MCLEGRPERLVANVVRDEHLLRAYSRSVRYTCWIGRVDQPARWARSKRIAFRDQFAQFLIAHL